MTKNRIKTVTPITGDLSDDDRPLHNEDGSLTARGLLTLRSALNSPQWHHTVDLSIKGFKRYLRTIPLLTKSEFNEQVREYRKKAWQDYAELVQFKGSFPTVTQG